LTPDEARWHASGGCSLDIGAGRDERENAAVPETLVELDDIGMTYKTAGEQTLALDGLSLDVRRGEFVSIVGPSGCGKSTLLQVATGLLPPTRGQVRINGNAVTKPYTDVGIAFQSPVLLEWRTALQNVLLQFEMRGIDTKPRVDEAMALLDSVGLRGFEHRYPRELSGGMRQRVGLARALVHNPPLMLMDEPFSAVDALTRDQLVVDLQELCLARGAGLTVIFITHHIEEAVFLSDRVLVMTPRPGRVAELLDIDLPRPRSLLGMDDEAFLFYTRRIRKTFVDYGVFRDPRSVDGPPAGAIA
jgi:NitT/TauT family transport system ATP-binding protein